MGQDNSLFVQLIELDDLQIDTSVSGESNAMFGRAFSFRMAILGLGHPGVHFDLFTTEFDIFYAAKNPGSHRIVTFGHLFFWGVFPISTTGNR